MILFLSCVVWVEKKDDPFYNVQIMSRNGTLLHLGGNPISRLKKCVSSVSRTDKKQTGTLSWGSGFCFRFCYALYHKKWFRTSSRGSEQRISPEF